MKIHTQAVHSGDRKQAPPQIPVTTPVYTAASYVTDGLDMTMTYTFAFQLSPVQSSIVFNSGVLPRPCGVAASVVQL